MRLSLSFVLAAFTSAAAAGTAAPQVECRRMASALELYCRGRLVLRYHTAVVTPPSGIDAVYSRSGFIHPVATPSGRVVTADFPADHAHQHGIFSAWVHTTFEGRKVDFWNQAGRTGNVEHLRVIDTTSGAESGEFTVELRHLDLTAPGGPKPVLSELWTVRLYDGEGPFIFDLTSSQTCIAASPLTVNEYHYGGIAFRGTAAWFAADQQQPTDFEFVTSAGLGRREGNHTRPQWVVAHGSIEGRMCGIAVLGHPSNPRAPEPVRLHGSKPYFAFSPCVLGEFEMPPGATQVRRYRYIVFDGPTDAAELARQHQAWTAAAIPTAAD